MKKLIILTAMLNLGLGLAQSKMLLASMQQGENPNPEEYTNSNAFAKLNNANALTGLDVFGDAAQASVAETGGGTTHVWQITSTTALNNLARGREVLSLSNSTGTYEYEFWARGIGTDSGGWRAATWTNVAVSPSHQFTTTWTKYSGTFTATTANPIANFYTNRSSGGGAVGSVGDQIQVTGFTVKEL